MLFNKSNGIVAFILGLCLLQSASASTWENLVAYNGKVGHATSCNYPFKHHSGNIFLHVYTYRLYTGTASAQKLCLTFHRFELDLYGMFAVQVETTSGTELYRGNYNRQGEAYNHSSNSPLPDNIWKQPFCVNLAGDRFLELTYLLNPNTVMAGFFLEYTTTTSDTIDYVTAPCGSGLFTCYNRECVNDSYVCTNKPACTDLSHNTYAHAFCKDSGSPIQQSGFWANDLDNSWDDITVDYGWKMAKEVSYPGPPSDHTGGGKFLYTMFSPTRYDLGMTFYPGKLVQKENCLSFWYYMDGPDLGELSAEWGLSKVWQRAGSYGAKWLQAQVNLICESGQNCDQKVKITASRASNPDTRISVDDISVMPGLCTFYEADIVKDAWTEDDGCSSTNGRLTCSSLSASSGLTKSWLVSRGKCLVGKVKFDFNTNPTQTVMVFKYPVEDGSEVHLKTLRQSTAHQEIRFKISIPLTINSYAVKIGFRTIFNKGRISLENIHVVDNECDKISFVDEELTTARTTPNTTNTAAPPAHGPGNTSMAISGIVIGVIVAVSRSFITLGIYI